MWIAQVTRALPGPDAGLNMRQAGAWASANIGDGIAKTVADRGLGLGWMFLKDSLTQIDLGKALRAIGAVIDGGAIGRRAEEIVRGFQIRQGPGQQRLECLAIDPLARLVIGGAGRCVSHR